MADFLQSVQQSPWRGNRIGEDIVMQTVCTEEYYRLLHELQVVDFAALELSLYLDTHPGDEQAVRQFNGFVQQRMQLAQQYESQYGPLLQYGHSYSRFPWAWPATPWPWQV